MSVSKSESWLLKYLDKHCVSPDQSGFITIDRHWKSSEDAKTDHGKAVASEMSVTCDQLEGMISRLEQLGYIGKTRTSNSLHVWITAIGQDAARAVTHAEANAVAPTSRRSNSTAIDRLSSLRDEFNELTPYPWSVVESWVARATPILRHDWASHFEDFQHITAMPRWKKAPKTLSELKAGAVARTDAIEDSLNRAIAEDAKNRILAFIDGLLNVATAISASPSVNVSTSQITSSAKSGHTMLRRIGVMIGSPGDATEERHTIKDTIICWNGNHSVAKGVTLEPVMWEFHATPGLGGRPQGMINDQLVSRADCLIAIFRGRAGSPTGVELSGTIEEIRECVKLGKYVAVYFYNGSVRLNSIDADQLKIRNDFKREIQQQGLTGEYSDSHDLAKRLAFDLSSIVEKIVSDESSSGKSQANEQFSFKSHDWTMWKNRGNRPGDSLIIVGRWARGDIRYSVRLRLRNNRPHEEVLHRLRIEFANDHVIASDENAFDGNDVVLPPGKWVALDVDYGLHDHSVIEQAKTVWFRAESVEDGEVLRWQIADLDHSTLILTSD